MNDWPTILASPAVPVNVIAAELAHTAAGNPVIVGLGYHKGYR